MSKGTKVLRFGRIQQLIENLKLESAFYMQQYKSPLTTEYGKLVYIAQANQIDSIIDKLESLGE